LKFDFEEVERVHAEHGYRARADSCERMILQAEAAAMVMTTTLSQR
jgi:hypothetical protein